MEVELQVYVDILTLKQRVIFTRLSHTRDTVQYSVGYKNYKQGTLWVVWSGEGCFAQQ